jgi:hypothetical protein
LRFVSVLCARATPTLIASSKLFVEEAMISVTFATDMLDSFCLVSNRFLLALASEEEGRPDRDERQEQYEQLRQAPAFGQKACADLFPLAGGPGTAFLFGSPFLFWFSTPMRL